MSTETTTGATSVAPAPAVPAPPVRPFTALHGPAEDEARTIGAQLLAEYDRHPASMIAGSRSGGLVSWTSIEYRTNHVAFRVSDPDTVASEAAWHRYWRQNTSDRGGYDLKDPEKMAAAPPQPHRSIAYVCEGTWEQLRGWLDAPQQTSLFDTLGGGA